MAAVRNFEPLSEKFNVEVMSITGQLTWILSIYTSC